MSYPETGLQEKTGKKGKKYDKKRKALCSVQYL
jgi:hypothetical protein